MNKPWYYPAKSGQMPAPTSPSNIAFSHNARLEWASLHTGTVGFAFADGSVHFLSDSVDCDPSVDWAYDWWAKPNGNPPKWSTYAATGGFTLQNLYWPQDGNAIRNNSIN
jgi:prepilin-type processing-associated H-X9-DG protein